MKYKLQLFISHLIISILLVSLIAGFVFFVWYPFPLATAVGVNSIFIMMLIIDVVLGPLLTFLVAKKGKKTLKMDLITIGIIQIMALFYGVYSISITRPVYIVYDNIRFDLVQANQIDDSRLHYGQPKYFAVKSPKSDDENMQRIQKEMETGISPSLDVQLYEDIKLNKKQIFNSRRSLKELEQFNEPKLTQTLLSKHPKAMGFLPLKTVGLDMTVLIDEQGEVLKIVDLRPW